MEQLDSHASNDTFILYMRISQITHGKVMITFSPVLNIILTSAFDKHH
jgi:hypothetical protein